MSADDFDVEDAVREFDFDVLTHVSNDAIVKRETTLLDGTYSMALFSRDDRHRFVLTRVEHGHVKGNTVTFIMLNPSTATHEVRDPTVTRCINFARRWGFTGLHVVNLFSYRSTLPIRLRDVPDADGGVYNAYAILRAARDARVVVCAWGEHGTIGDRQDTIVPILRKYVSNKLFALGRNKGGAPKHPLYVRNDATLGPFDMT